MTIKAAIESIASWLDVVHVESAQRRIDEMLERAEIKGRHVGLLVDSAELERVALHESAHAVLALHIGLTVREVVLRDDGSGFARYEAEEGEHLALALADLAGVSAELYVGVDQHREFVLAHSHDVLQARLRIEELAGLSSSTLAKLALASVVTHWPSIVRTAKVLIALGELDEPLLRALVANGPVGAVQPATVGTNFPDPARDAE